MSDAAGSSDPRLFYAEWGLEEGADPEDVDGWYRANPALGIRIDESFVRAELDALRATPEQFARERLGIPEQPVDLTEMSPVPSATWVTLVDKESSIVDARRFALDVSPDRRWSTYGMAGRRADGLLHVETFDHRPGTRWVLERGVEIWRRELTSIRIDKAGPAAAFISLLRERGVTVDEVSTAEHAQAAGQFIDAAINGQLRHLGQLSLDQALKGAVLRPSGDTELWGRRSSRMDITPLVAVTLALGGVPAVKKPATARVAVL